MVNFNELIDAKQKYGSAADNCLLAMILIYLS